MPNVRQLPPPEAVVCQFVPGRYAGKCFTILPSPIARLVYLSSPAILYTCESDSHSGLLCSLNSPLTKGDVPSTAAPAVNNGETGSRYKVHISTSHPMAIAPREGIVSLKFLTVDPFSSPPYSFVKAVRFFLYILTYLILINSIALFANQSITLLNHLMVDNICKVFYESIY